jgi:hypothetical protein
MKPTQKDVFRHIITEYDARLWQHIVSKLSRGKMWSPTPIFDHLTITFFAILKQPRNGFRQNQLQKPSYVTYNTEQ